MTLLDEDSGLTWRDGRDSIIAFWDLEKTHRQFVEGQLRAAERLILSYRRRLRAIDPSLPDEYDGAAWQPIEEHMVHMTLTTSSRGR